MAIRSELPLMDAETMRLQRMEVLFHAALEMDAADRDTFLQRECGGDTALVEDVLQLLGSEEEIESFVATPEPEKEDRWVGRRIGVFHILERIGRGGMGVVYRGERRDEFVQSVAIKLMSSDLLEPLAQERFLRERDVLAGLEHRNIVRLIDGGVTEDSFPYLAMEYVRGRRIDEVCDDSSTPVNTVLSLFLDVCEAVNYVHRNLLLHRDLKPANVLVTEDGLVKLLDFGTFKSLQQNDTSLTQPGMQAMTVRYASPEQLQSQAASTASDVFSLGVMLYRLLLAGLPERWDDLTVSRYIEALAMEEPGPIAEPLRRRWGMSAQLAGDLEAIIRKALRFRAEDRYQDADALADDLLTAIASRTIVAARIGRGDRAVRFLRRNRSTAVLAACTVLLFAMGVALLVRGGQHLRAEQARAERGLSDEAGLAHFLLVDYFEELKGIPESTNAQRQAISQALAYVDRLPDGVMPFQEDRLQAYTEMGSLLGNPYENNLGDTSGAIRELQKAVDVGRELVANQPKDDHDRQLYADANLALGRVYFGDGKPAAAERYLLAGVKENRELIAKNPHVDAASLAIAAASVDGLGDVYGLDGAVTLNQPASAIRAYREAQELDARGLALDPACARCRRGVALEYWKIGMALPEPRDSAGNFEAGLRTLDAFAPAELATARVQRLRTLIVQKLGTTYLAIDRVQDGIAMLNEVRRGLQKTAAADPTDSRAHYDLYALDFNLAEFLDMMGPAADDLVLDQEILREAELLQHFDPDNAVLKEHAAAARLRLGRSEIRFGDAGRGMMLAREAEKTLEGMAHSADVTALLLQDAADAEIAIHGDGAFAVECVTKAIKASPNPNSNQLMTLAGAQVLAGNLAEAHRAADEVLHSADRKRDDPVTLAQDERAKALLHASSLGEASVAIWGSTKARQGGPQPLR